jgi:hypothetical protein
MSTWATSLIARNYDLLQERIQPGWLPALADVRAGRGVLQAALETLGCGAYGCVMGALDPDVVLKVTTDVTEAEFAAHRAATLSVPVTVGYYSVLALAERHAGVPVYVLWREAAADVGKLGAKMGGVRPGSRGYKAEMAIHEQHEAAHALLLCLVEGRSHHRALATWKDSLLAMAKRVPELDYLAKGLIRVADEDGVALLDVHGGNLGRCMRDGQLTWVVIDPGHALELPKEGAKPATGKHNPARRTPEDYNQEVHRLFLDRDPASVSVIDDIAREREANALDFYVDFSEWEYDRRENQHDHAERGLNTGATEDEWNGEFVLDEDAPIKVVWRLIYGSRHGWQTVLYVWWNEASWEEPVLWAQTLIGYHGGLITNLRATVAAALELLQVMRRHHASTSATYQKSFWQKHRDRWDLRKVMAEADGPRTDGEIRRGDTVRVRDSAELGIDEGYYEIQNVANGKLTLFGNETTISGVPYPHPDISVSVVRVPHRFAGY